MPAVAKAKARREHIMAKIVYKMEGNRKGSAFTAWKGQWVRAKEAEAKVKSSTRGSQFSLGNPIERV